MSLIKKNKLFTYTLASLLLLSSFQEIVLPSKAEASETRTVTVPYGTINKYMKWEDPKIVNYPNSDYGNYPSTISYDKDGFTGTLNAKRIILKPKQKDYHKDAIYRTEYQTFNKSYAANYSNKNDSNLPSQYWVDENGYQGNIPRTSTTWTDNWVRGRTVWHTQYWQDWANREFDWEVPVPYTYDGWYYDSATGQNVWYSLPKSGGLYTIYSTKEWINYRAPGSAAYYDKNANYYLGFMSNNSTSYYAGRWTDAYPGEAPDRYYGLPRYLSPSDVRLIGYGWDEPYAVNSDYWASLGYWDKLVYSNGSYWWRSESGKLNKYRRGVWIDYQLYVTKYRFQQNYAGTVYLPDYIKDYTGTGYYSGTLSKQVLDHYDEYYTSNDWDVSVEYAGTVYSTNLTAKSLAITDLSGNPVSYLVKGKQYKATMVTTNSGELDVGAYKVGFYEQGTLKTTLDVASHTKGTDKTLTYNFTASTSGTPRNFMMKADNDNVIDETNETDNTASQNKNVYYVNLNAKSINITNPDGSAASYLVRGKTYKATMVISNDGEIDTGAYKVGFYEQGILKTSLDVTSHTKGTDKTLTYSFTASTSGTPRTFMVKADDLDVIEESNELDNTASQNKNVYYVNLKAKSISITDINGNIADHLVKGKNYKVNMVIANDGEIDTGAYKVGFYEQGTLVTTLDISSHVKGTDKNLSYQFTANTAGQRTFMIKADDNNVVEESNETDNTIDTTKLVNTLPTFTLTYTPSTVYEGDNVNVCVNPNDADNDAMSVILEMSKDGGPFSIVMNKTGVYSGQQQCYNINPITKGTYTFKTTVSDGWDQVTGSISFVAKELTIVGRVLHTPQWTIMHQRIGNAPDAFYSGEEFVLESDITNYPAEYVKVYFNGGRVDGSILKLTTDLTKQSNILYKGSLYDPSMSKAQTQLKKGPVTFTFEVKYTNGVIKQATVTPTIIGNVYSAFNFHRLY